MRYYLSSICNHGWPTVNSVVIVLSELKIKLHLGWLVHLYQPVSQLIPSLKMRTIQK